MCEKSWHLFFRLETAVPAAEEEEEEEDEGEEEEDENAEEEEKEEEEKDEEGEEADEENEEEAKEEEEEGDCCSSAATASRLAERDYEAHEFSSCALLSDAEVCIDQSCAKAHKNEIQRFFFSSLSLATFRSGRC